MIYTLTLNPTLDYIVRVDDFMTNKINTTTYEKILAGGKGINVSLVLSNLGHKSTALGFIAGFTGREIQNRLSKTNVITKFIEIEEGFSRINIKLKSIDETEINGRGPKIKKQDVEQLFKQLDELQANDILVISGSVPKTLPDDIYETILKYLSSKQVKIIVDATKTLLLKTLAYHPFLIKPNHHELGDLFNVSLNTKEEVIPYAMKLKNMGACNVLVSMADKGAVLIDENNFIHKHDALKGELINSVGAGDSMVAGFLAGYLESKGDYEQSFIKAICSGSASAFSEELATLAEVNELMKNYK